VCIKQKAPPTKNFFFFQPTGEFLIETEKGKGSEFKKPRSREFKDSPALRILKSLSDLV